MSGQPKRRQSKTGGTTRQQRGPRSARMFHSRGHCVRTEQGFHALVYLDPRHAAAVRPGQRAEITTRSLPQVALAGRVLTIAAPGAAGYGPPGTEPGPAHHPGHHLVTVEVIGTHPRLRHGMAVEVLIATHTIDDVLRVPNSAVIRHQSEFYVEVLEPTGERHHVQFTPGLIGYRDTEVLAGLSEGQTLILTPDPLPA
jgi:multidrug efflux pump subunit AcrA (membrane-fusion protein)